MHSLSIESRYGIVLAEAANYFRKIALEIDNNPNAILHHCNHSSMNILTHLAKINCFDRVKMYEALAYGDPGVLLACPGSSLSGFLIEALGDECQKKIFYEQLENTTRTFLAVTEPQHGSNLSEMKTRIHSNKLCGEKWLVSHGATGELGIVIIKTGDGPLCARALMFTSEYLKQSNHIQRRLLPMIGLRGACLSRIIFNELTIEPDYLLGNHLKPIEHGMMALIKTFNQMRPCVGALAIGVAQAAVDYVSDFLEISKYENTILHLQSLINVARNLLYIAAKEIDQNSLDSGLSSLAKARATQTAEIVITSIFDKLSATHLLMHPLLMKWYRDVWGFEYMEGVRNIHQLNVFNEYRKKMNLVA